MAGSQNGSLSPEAMDELLARTESTLQDLAVSQGSKVRLPKAELSLLQDIEDARDFMMAVLQGDAGDRRLLRSIFGGDCTRISKMRALLEEMPAFSNRVACDRRAAACLDACECLEHVLRDLGLGFAMQRALDKERQARRPSKVGPEGLELQEMLAEQEPVCQDLVAGEVLATLEVKLPSKSCDDEIVGDVQNASTTPREPAPEPRAREAWLEEDTVTVNEPSPEPTELECEPEPCGSPTTVAEPDAMSELLEECRSPVEAPLSPYPIQDGSTRSSELLSPPNVSTPGSQASRKSSSSQAAAALRRLLPGEDGCAKAPIGKPKASMSLLHRMERESQTRKAAPASPGTSSSVHSPVQTPARDAAGADQPEESFDLLAAIEIEKALPADYREMLRRLFAHYLGPGGLCCGGGMGLAKFRRLLRDALWLHGGSSAEDGKFRLKPGQIVLTVTEADIAFATAAASAGKLMTCPAFVLGLQAAACRAFPSASYKEALLQVCADYLQPLADKVLGNAGDLKAAVEALMEPQVAALMKRSQQSLRAVFTRFSRSPGAAEPYRSGHWTLDSMSRFAAEVGLSAELSHSSLHSLFGDCTGFEASHGRGDERKMAFGGFLLILMAVALRLRSIRQDTSSQKLGAFLVQVSRIPGASDLAGVALKAVRTIEPEGPKTK